MKSLNTKILFSHRKSHEKKQNSRITKKQPKFTKHIRKIYSKTILWILTTCSCLPIGSSMKILNSDERPATAIGILWLMSTRIPMNCSSNSSNIWHQNTTTFVSWEMTTRVSMAGEGPISAISWNLQRTSKVPKLSSWKPTTVQQTPSSWQPIP